MQVKASNAAAGYIEFSNAIVEQVNESSPEEPGELSAIQGQSQSGHRPQTSSASFQIRRIIGGSSQNSGQEMRDQLGSSFVFSHCSDLQAIRSSMEKLKASSSQGEFQQNQFIPIAPSQAQDFSRPSVMTFQIPPPPAMSQFIPPPPPPLMLMSVAESLTKSIKTQSNMIRLPLTTPSLKPSSLDSTIFGLCQSFQDQEAKDLLCTKLSKNFKKVVCQSKASKINPPTLSSIGEAKKIDNTLDYQRSIAIQTALKKYQFNSDMFLQQVSEGDINGLNCEQLEIFERIFPRSTEIQRLKEFLFGEGFDTFEDAQRVFEFGICENFIIKCSSIPNLEKKAQILLRIIRFIDGSRESQMVIERWIQTFDFVIGNSALREVAAYTFMCTTVMNPGEKISTFDISNLLKLFEIKSSTNASKNLYHYILKYAYKMGERDFTILCEHFSQESIQIFSESQLEHLRHCIKDGFEAVPGKMSSLTSVYDFVQGQIQAWDQCDSTFYQAMRLFVSLYEQTAKDIFEALKDKLDSRLNAFLLYFCESSSECVDKILQSLFEFHLRHHKSVEKFITQQKSKLVALRNAKREEEKQQKITTPVAETQKKGFHSRKSSYMGPATPMSRPEITIKKAQSPTASRHAASSSIAPLITPGQAKVKAQELKREVAFNKTTTKFQAKSPSGGAGVRGGSPKQNNSDIISSLNTSNETARTAAKTSRQQLNQTVNKTSPSTAQKSSGSKSRNTAQGLTSPFSVATENTMMMTSTSKKHPSFLQTATTTKPSLIAQKRQPLKPIPHASVNTLNTSK